MSGNITVALTQFMRPNGRQVPVACDVPESLAPNYKAILDAGCRLTCEVLMTDMVSQAIEHEEGDFAIELCANKPGVAEIALQKLIGEFDIDEFNRWLEEVEEAP